jgi:hypothetical protein
VYAECFDGEFTPKWRAFEQERIGSDMLIAAGDAVVVLLYRLPLWRRYQGGRRAKAVREIDYLYSALLIRGRVESIRQHHQGRVTYVQGTGSTTTVRFTAARFHGMTAAGNCNVVPGLSIEIRLPKGVTVAEAVTANV